MSLCPALVRPEDLNSGPLACAASPLPTAFPQPRPQVFRDLYCSTVSSNPVAHIHWRLPSKRPVLPPLAQAWPEVTHIHQVLNIYLGQPGSSTATAPHIHLLFS